jgi:hypothetical protein
MFRRRTKVVWEAFLVTVCDCGGIFGTGTIFGDAERAFSLPQTGIKSVIRRSWYYQLLRGCLNLLSVLRLHPLWHRRAPSGCGLVQPPWTVKGNLGNVTRLSGTNCTASEMAGGQQGQELLITALCCGV